MKVKGILFLLMLCFFIRAIPAHYFYGAYDVYSAETQYKIMKEGDLSDLWTKVGHPHSPVTTWGYYLVGLFAEKTGLPFSTVVKFPAILSDLAITVLIYLSVLKLRADSRKAFLSGLFYALNPLIVIITGLNGQFDSTTILFCLLSWYFWRFGAKGSLVLSALFLGIGIVVKEFPIILYPLFFFRLKDNRERFIYTAAMLLPVFAIIVLSVLFYTPEFMVWLTKYQAMHGFWGISLILQFLEHRVGGFFILLNNLSQQNGRFLLLPIFLFIWIAFRKRLDLISAIVMIFSAFYFFTSGLGVQYLVWIIPFAIIKGDRMTCWFTLFTAILAGMWFEPVLRGSYNLYYSHSSLYNLTRNMFSVIAWGTCGFWLFRILREAGFLLPKEGKRGA